MLVRQTMLLRSQQDPIPLVKEFSFEGNTLKISIENAGNGPASSLAIACDLVLARRALFRDSGGAEPISASEAAEALEGGKQPYMRYELNVGRWILDDGKKTRPTPVACLLINEAKGSTMLLPHESYTYSLEPKFGLGEHRGDPTSFPPFQFLVELLTKNGIDCFSVGFDLIGKNAADDPIQRQGLAMFVVDLAKDKTLQDAYKAKVRPYYEPMDYMEVARNLPLDVGMYLRSKSGVNYPKYFEEGKPW